MIELPKKRETKIVKEKKPFVAETPGVEEIVTTEKTVALPEEEVATEKTEDISLEEAEKLVAEVEAEEYKPLEIEKKGEEATTDKQLTEQVKSKIYGAEPEEVYVKKEKLAKGMVKVRVLVGTLKFDEFTYEKGDVFTVSKKRTEGFDPRFFEIIE